jgi:hypothetical protein
MGVRFSRPSVVDRLKIDGFAFTFGSSGRIS